MKYPVLYTVKARIEALTPFVPVKPLYLYQLSNWSYIPIPDTD